MNVERRQAAADPRPSHDLGCESACTGVPLPRRLTETKVIWDSSPNFRINPDSDPDVCQVAATKMLWIH